MKQKLQIVPVASLGPAQFASPLRLSTVEGDGVGTSRIGQGSRTGPAVRI